MLTLYRYIAYCKDGQSDDLYKYARENGHRDAVRSFEDIMDALKVLPDFETTCEKKQGNEPYWEIVCYALEGEQ